MKKDSIIQFTCFGTQMELDEFMPKWESYAKKFMPGTCTGLLQDAGAKSRYKYVSQHEHTQNSDRLPIAKGRNEDHFAEPKVKVLQCGGYTILQAVNSRVNKDSCTKIMAFVSHSENDIDFYRQLLPSSVNIFEAYYESCTYSYILEYFVPEIQAEDILQQLKSRHGVEVSVYKECLVPAL
jgi:hypothetical protein